MSRRWGEPLTHGHYIGKKATPTLATYTMMIRRCYDEKSDQFPFYGGRGIQVCDNWRSDFMNFLRDMGERPKGKFLDRKDNDGDYTPENCRWVTHKQNCRNRRSTRWVIVKGERYTFKEFGDTFCIGWHTNLYNRLRQGWEWKRILDTYLKPELKDELSNEEGGYNVTLGSITSSNQRSVETSGSRRKDGL
jgi:hypothetical protein